jgi:hypothetical protein
MERERSAIVELHRAGKEIVKAPFKPRYPSNGFLCMVYLGEEGMYKSSVISGSFKTIAEKRMGQITRGDAACRGGFSAKEIEGSFEKTRRIY